MSVIAFNGEREIGLVGATKKNEKNLRIGIVSVNKAHQGKGVGTKLLTFLEKAAKEKAFDKLSLEVHRDNSRAKGLYAKMGFSESGVLKQPLETWTKRIN